MLYVETTGKGFPMGTLGLSGSLSLTARILLPAGQFMHIREVWRWWPLFETWADYQPGEHGEFDKLMEKLRPEFIANRAKMECMVKPFR